MISGGLDSTLALVKRQGIWVKAVSFHTVSA